MIIGTVTNDGSIFITDNKYLVPAVAEKYRNVSKMRIKIFGENHNSILVFIKKYTHLRIVMI